MAYSSCDLLPELEAVIETAWTEHQELAKAGTICPYVFHRAGQPIRSYRRARAKACELAGVPGGDAGDRPPDPERLSALRHYDRGRCAPGTLESGRRFSHPS